MPDLFTAEQRVAFRELFDDVLTSLGKDCRLYYPVPQSATSYAPDPIGNKPGNAWRTGGRVRHQELGGPLNAGSGTRAVEVYDTVRMTLNFEPKKFARPVPSLDLRLPYSLCETRALLTDLPKIERCSYATFQVGIEGVAGRKYKLHGESLDTFQFVQGRYAISTWERI